MKLGIVGVPTSAGARVTGPEQAPASLRNTGLTERLRDDGHDVVDYGDTESFKYSPDLRNPKAQNKLLVLRVCRLVAEKVEKVARQGLIPLVLGGDCSIAIGTLAAMTGVFPDTGLIYMDGDADLNTPETTPSGIIDGMVVAHLIGRGIKELSHMGNRYPILKEENIALFGLNLSTGYVDPPEIKFLETSPIALFTNETIRDVGPKTVAEQILAGLKSKVDKVFVHFDVDTIDSTEMPAKHLPHPNGLCLTDVEKALRVFAQDTSFLGIEITEFNPDRDPGHRYAKNIVELIASSLRQSTATM